jgi:hypothetical protein
MTIMIVLTYTSVLPSFFVIFFITNDKCSSCVSPLATLQLFLDFYAFR